VSPEVFPIVDIPPEYAGAPTEIVEPFVDRDTIPVAERELVAGARIESVPPFAPVVCERDTGPDPTSTN
jgi:hypothetical protein